MSLIAHIDNVPLFTTIAEAELWAKQYDLTGYHEHVILGQTGYMGGENHADIVSAMRSGVVNPITPSEVRTASGTVSSGGY
tara:strand:+ start:476 stop:718 length:243 start_codon:yes stop_codon:yes gene_type:complete